MLGEGWQIRRKDEQSGVLQVLFCPEDCLKPVIDIDFMKDVVEVSFDGMRADIKPVGNRLIRCAGR